MPILPRSNEDCCCLEYQADNPICPVHSRPQTGNRLAQLIAGAIALIIGGALIVAAVVTAFGGL